MIANTFIKRPVTAIVISTVLVISGVICIFNLAVDQYPDISPPSVSVSGNYTGADAQTTEAWLARRAPEVITQAEARALAARLKAPKTPTPSSRPKPPVAEASQAGDPVATPATEAGASASVNAATSAATCVVEVAIDGRVGELLLDRDPPGPSEAWVRFGRDGSPSRVALAGLTIARIGRARGDERPGV